MCPDYMKEITCIVCPIGCKMTVERKGDKYIVSVNQCKRGEDYAIEELTHPTRMLTGTVGIVNALHQRLPVHSSAALPKELLFEAMKIIRTCKVEAPVRCGQLIIKNILETGIDICASREMEAL